MKKVCHLHLLLLLPSPQAKAAFTRAYNAVPHKSQALVEAITAPKKGKKNKASAGDGEDDGEEDGGDAEEEEEEEEMATQVSDRRQQRVAYGSIRIARVGTPPRSVTVASRRTSSRPSARRRAKARRAARRPRAAQPSSQRRAAARPRKARARARRRRPSRPPSRRRPSRASSAESSDDDGASSRRKVATTALRLYGGEQRRRRRFVFTAERSDDARRAARPCRSWRARPRRRLSSSLLSLSSLSLGLSLWGFFRASLPAHVDSHGLCSSPCPVSHHGTASPRGMKAA